MHAFRVTPRVSQADLPFWPACCRDQVLDAPITRDIRDKLSDTRDIRDDLSDTRDIRDKLSETRDDLDGAPPGRGIMSTLPPGHFFDNSPTGP